MLRGTGVLCACLLAGCHAPTGGSTSTSSSTTGGDEGTTAAVATTASTTTAGASAGSGGASEATGDPSTTEASTSAAATSEASTSEDASSSGTTGVDAESCKKLDILFLVVDSGYIGATRKAINALMPHLAQRLEVEFADWDYHVMFANPDGKWGNGYCEDTCEEGDPCETTVPYPCGYEPDVCDLTRSAGITFPAGSAASNVQCPIDGDRRYVVRGQSDLPGTLGCLGRIGGGYGGNKLFAIARSTLDALDAPLNAPGACNEGFFRGDAYLILFVVAPFPDILSEGTPADWTKELKAHKGGKFDKIYFIGLFNGCDTTIEWWEYEPLFEWAESFYYHQADDACTESVLPYMDPALDYVLGDCPE